MIRSRAFRSPFSFRIREVSPVRQLIKVCWSGSFGPHSTFVAKFSVLSCQFTIALYFNVYSKPSHRVAYMLHLSTHAYSNHSRLEPLIA